jgi:diketogulonate reductase-like aldo/keto reductase
MREESVRTTRRAFLMRASAAGAALGLAGCLSPGSAVRDAPAVAKATPAAMPKRKIPSTGELLPVIGLGSSKPVDEIAKNGEEPITAVLRALVAHGGKLVDTWPRNVSNDAAFGRVASLPDLRDNLFVTTKIDKVGKEAGIAQFRETQRNYQRKKLDLVQIFSLTDLDVHWPTLKDLKAAGEARYIGVTVAESRLYGQLEAFLKREKPDFIQVNYSITEREAESRILPFAAQHGLAVLINRPFMNGTFFDKLKDQPLPGWAADFDCKTWAQFSLKYILANAAVTCVLTETSNPQHMADNAETSRGRVPNAEHRKRMATFIDGV